MTATVNNQTTTTQATQKAAGVAKKAHAPKAPKVKAAVDTQDVRVKAQAPKIKAADLKLEDAQGANVGSVVNGGKRDVGSTMKSVLGLNTSAQSLEATMKDAKIGVVSTLPIDALMYAADYRNGKTTAKQYVGKVVGDSLGFGAWTFAAAGAAAVAAPLLGAGALAGIGVAAIGFTAGMIANDLFDRTIGKGIGKAVAAVVPNAIATPMAKVFSTIEKPIGKVFGAITGFAMKHKILGAVALGALALKFPAAGKVLGKTLAPMAVGTAAALGIEHFTINKFLPADDASANTAQDANAANAQGPYNSALANFNPQQYGASAQAQAPQLSYQQALSAINQ